MKIRQAETLLKYVQWCVPFWFYYLVIESELDFAWQWKLYAFTVLAIAGIYVWVEHHIGLSKTFGYEVYLIFSIITQLTAGALSFDEMRHIGLNFSDDLSVAYQQYFLMKILFNLVGMSLLPVAFKHFVDKYSNKGD
ncbi:hypothetical protein BMT54_01150 [Pasteurellaceae bacterium 15-036681]|nr:hypothetical protein BMT54_01150 [Pasteurellaceae bacterium 15-036681]